MPSLCHREKTFAPSLWRCAILDSVHGPPRLQAMGAGKDGLANFDHPHKKPGATALSQRSPLPALGRALAYSGMPSFSNQFAVCCHRGPRGFVGRVTITDKELYHRSNVFSE